jgi:hypothetical protein
MKNFTVILYFKHAKRQTDRHDRTYTKQLVFVHPVKKTNKRRKTTSLMKNSRNYLYLPECYHTGN